MATSAQELFRLNPQGLEILQPTAPISQARGKYMWKVKLFIDATFVKFTLTQASDFTYAKLTSVRNGCLLN